MINWKMFLTGLVITVFALVIELVNLIHMFTGGNSDMVGLIGVLLAGIGIFTILKGAYN